MDIRYDWLRIFFEVCKTGNISNTAKKSYISQSAISQSIAKLENNLGISLFERSKKGVKLTYEGSILYEQVEKGIQFFESGINMVMEMKGLKKGKLKIASTDTILKYFLLKPIAEFKSKYPGIDISVYNFTSKECYEKIRSGIAHIGVANLNDDDKAKMEKEHIFNLNDSFVSTKEFLKDKGSINTFEKLLEFPIVTLESGTFTRQVLDEAFMKRGLVLKPTYEVGSFDLVIECVKMGFGIGFVPSEFYIKDSLLKKVNIEEFNHVRKIGMFYRNEGYVSEIVKEFTRFIKEYQY